MAALKSLTFTTLPTPRADRTLDRRARTIARLEEQKLLLKDPNYTRTVRTWRTARNQWRKPPADFAVVANALEWLLCVVCSEQVEANRVREGKDRNCGPVIGQAAIRDRYADFRDPCWRT